jgi:type III secretion protein Q
MQTLLARPTDAVTELGLAAPLPRLASPLAQALSQLYGRAAPLTFNLRGTVQRLQWAWARSASPMFESFRLRLGHHTGHVGIDTVALARLLGERQIELLPRELRCVLWAEALHALVEAVEAATRLRIEWVAQSDDEPLFEPDAQRAAGFVLHADGIETCGFVHFDDDAAWQAVLPLLPPAPPRAPITASQARVLDALHLPLPFTLGSTSITLREVRAVRPGDIVSIEDWQSSGPALRVSARAGGRGRLHFAGLAEGSRITVHSTGEQAMNRDAPMAAPPGDDAGQLPLDRLDALEVTLRFEVGDLALSLGELRSIRAGHVFELGAPLNRSPVRILAHGNVLGKGYLVAVGERLGVRVSEFAPSEL